MELIILGSGVCAQTLKRGESGYILKIKDEPILFDSGSGILRQVLRSGVNFRGIDYIFYTHTHNDHINDLPAFIWAYNHDKPNPRERPLTLFGPEGFKEYFDILLHKILNLEKLEFGVNIREVRDDEIKTKSWTAKTKSIPHMERWNSVGYRIESEGKVFVYCGDSAFSENLIELSKNADVLILDCSYPNELKVKEHLIPSEAGEIAAKANAKKLILTHLYPICEKHDMKKQAQEKFRGEIILAEDMMRVKV